MSKAPPVVIQCLDWHTLMNHLDVITVDEGKRTRNGVIRPVERFTLGKLTRSQLEWLKGFHNVELGKAAYRHAPEITHPVVYLYH